LWSIGFLKELILKQHTQEWQSTQPTEECWEEAHVNYQLWGQKDEKDKAIKPGHLAQYHGFDV
jgi:hypothetical protein